MSATGSHAFGLHLTQAGLTQHRQVVGRRRRRRGGEKKKGRREIRDREMAGGEERCSSEYSCLPCESQNGGRAD